MIYFIQCQSTHLIKIGNSVQPIARFSQLNNGPTELEMLAIMDGVREGEVELHKRFESSRVRGEWFSPTKELIDFIDALPKKDDESQDISSQDDYQEITPEMIKNSVEENVYRALATFLIRASRSKGRHENK